MANLQHSSLATLSLTCRTVIGHKLACANAHGQDQHTFAFAKLSPPTDDESGASEDKTKLLLMDAQGESDRARRSRPVVGDFRFFFALATRRATGDS